MPTICGTDLSPRSAAALEVACALAAQRGEREVIAVHVVEEEAQAEVARQALDKHVATVTGPVSSVESVGFLKRTGIRDTCF